MTYQYYLAHPFLYRAEVRLKEAILESRIDGMTLFNPFYDEPRDEIEKFDSGEWGPEERKSSLDPSIIVPRDLMRVSESDGLLAVVANVTMCGTFMEIAYAKQMGKFIIVCDLREIPENHIWLDYHADKMVRSWEELEEYLDAIH